MEAGEPNKTSVWVYKDIEVGCVVEYSCKARESECEDDFDAYKHYDRLLVEWLV